jgi:hypothetical protein
MRPVDDDTGLDDEDAIDETERDAE